MNHLLTLRHLPRYLSPCIRTTSFSASTLPPKTPKEENLYQSIAKEERLCLHRENISPHAQFEGIPPVSCFQVQEAFQEGSPYVPVQSTFYNFNTPQNTVTSK